MMYLLQGNIESKGRRKEKVKMKIVGKMDGSNSDRSKKSTKAIKKD